MRSPVSVLRKRGTKEFWLAESVREVFQCKKIANVEENKEQTQEHKLVGVKRTGCTGGQGWSWGPEPCTTDKMDGRHEPLFASSSLLSYRCTGNAMWQNWQGLSGTT